MRGAKAAISGVPFFHILFLFGVVSFHNRLPPLQDMIYTRYYSVERRILYLPCIYTHRVLLPLFLMLWTGVVAAAPAAVRRRVPDGKSCCWFINSDSVQCFLSLDSNTMYL